MSTTPVTPPTSGTGTDSTTSGLPTSQSLNNMFLQLLVAQLQNQDPTAPVDPSTFVGQLAQFSELSEVTSIYQLMQQEAPSSTGSGSGGSGSSSGGSAGTAASGAAALSAASAATSAGSAAAASSIPGAISPVSSALPNFASPNISQLVTSKIQGAF